MLYFLRKQISTFRGRQYNEIINGFSGTLHRHGNDTGMIMSIKIQNGLRKCTAEATEFIIKMKMHERIDEKA